MSYPYAWALALGDILFHQNGDVLTGFGSIYSREEIQHDMLLRDWGVRNRGELLYTIASMKYEGHSSGYRHMLVCGPFRDHHQSFLEQYREILGDKQLLAWDAGRAVCLIRWGHYVGWLGFAEACRHLLAVARLVQPVYNSWESYFEHYSVGRRFWNPKVHPYEIHTKAFLLENRNSNWKRLDWAMTLSHPEQPPADPAGASPFQPPIADDEQQRLKNQDEYWHQWTSEKDPLNAKVLTWYGHFKADEQKDYRSAARLFERATQVDPQFAYAYLQAGYAFETYFQDLEKAFQFYEKGAELGEAACEYNLGNMYVNGRGVHGHVKKGIIWYEKSASHGDTDAMERLGDLYGDGEKIARDAEKALYWYRKGADEGQPGCLYSLAQYYQQGEVVAMDLEKAVSLYSRAADKDYLQAMLALAQMHDHGQGVEKDPVKAFHWCLKAAEAGYAKAQYECGLRYLHGNGVDCDPKQALSWFEKVADRDDAEVHAQLGAMYLQGLGVEADREKAREHLLKAVPESAQACFLLAELYLVEQQLAEAVRWYRQTDFKAYPAACMQLGKIYMQGAQGVEKDEKAARGYFSRGAELGDRDCQYYFARCCENGRGFLWKKLKQAYEWYHEAAKQEHPQAYLAIARFYAEGIYLDQDTAKAYEFYQRACQMQAKGAQEAFEAFKASLTDEQAAAVRHYLEKR